MLSPAAPKAPKAVRKTPARKTPAGKTPASKKPVSKSSVGKSSVSKSAKSTVRKKPAARIVATVAPPVTEAADATLRLVLARLDDMKAEDTVTIDLRGKSAYSDYMVVTSGRANRHVAAIAENVLKALKASGLKKLHVEGQANADWVLIDSGDVVLHIFRPEAREFYSLERLWKENPATAAKAR